MNTFVVVSILDWTTHRMVERFVHFLCDELDIRPETVRIVPCTEDGLFGACIDLTESDFLIMIKEKDRTITSIFNTIAHEMIHVKQHMKENLNHWLSFCKDIPYLERWWEVEAYNNSMPLVVKFTNEVVLENK